MRNRTNRILAVSLAGLAFAATGTTIANADDVIDPGDTAALAEAGITLSPGEQDASLVIVSTPGETVDVTYRPEGCEEVSCENFVEAQAPPAAGVGDAQATTRASGKKRPKVRAINGATIVKVKVKRKSTRATTRAYAPTWLRVMGDKKCGDSGPGCWTWLLTLNSRAYYDGDWAWGTRSRRGVSGAVDCNETRANGGSWSDKICKFYNDPSATGLYANSEATINAWGGIASKTHWLHRHYNKNGGTWLVTD